MLHPSYSELMAVVNSEVEDDLNTEHNLLLLNMP